VADPKNQRQSDAAEVAPRVDGLFKHREGFRKKARAHDHAEDAPQGVPAPFTERTHGGAGAITQKAPAETENKSTKNHRPQDGGVDGKFRQAQIVQKINPHHAHDHTREHELDDGHILQPSSSDTD